MLARQEMRHVHEEAPDQLEARGLELMVKWGTRMMETHLSLLDKKILAEKFPGAAELEKLRADKTLSRPGYISQDRFFEQFHVSSSSPQTYLVCAQPLSLGILLFSGVPFYAVATTPAGIWAPSDDDTSESELCRARRASSSVRSSL